MRLEAARERCLSMTGACGGPGRPLLMTPQAGERHGLPPSAGGRTSPAPGELGAVVLSMDARRGLSLPDLSSPVALSSALAGSSDRDPVGRALASRGCPPGRGLGAPGTDSILPGPVEFSE